MKTCEHCGKPYKLNKNLPESLSVNLRKLMEFIPDCDCSIKITKEKEEQNERLKLAEKIKKFKDISVIDKKFINSTFTVAEKLPHINTAKRYAEKLLIKNGNVGIAFYGESGTGKTYATACIANYLMEHGKTVIALNLGLYLNKLRLEWSEAETDILNKVQKCDLLILDDLGVEKLKEWGTEKLYTLIDARYRVEKPLIISTNLNFLSEEAIKKFFDKDFCGRIYDRLKTMCYPIKVTGKSRRETAEKSFIEFLT